MNEITERLSASIADRYRIEREVGAGGMVPSPPVPLSRRRERGNAVLSFHYHGKDGFQPGTPDLRVLEAHEHLLPSYLNLAHASPSPTCGRGARGEGSESES